MFKKRKEKDHSFIHSFIHLVSQSVSQSVIPCKSAITHSLTNCVNLLIKLGHAFFGHTRLHSSCSLQSTGRTGRYLEPENSIT